MKIEFTMKGRIAKNMNNKVVSIDDGSTVEIMEKDLGEMGRFVIVRIESKERCAIDIENR